MTWGPTRPLRAMAEVALGRQRSPEHADGPHMVRYLRAANVGDGTVDLSDVKEMNFSPAEQRLFALRPGDVLVTEGSGSLATVGASAVWRGEIDGTVCFQNTLLRLRPRSETDPEYLAWWCRHAFADGLFASVATGANIFHVSAERVRSLPIRCPDRHEQRAIADYLDTETTRIDALIAKKRRLIDLLSTKLRTKASRATLAAAVDPLNAGEKVELPPSWGAVQLRRCLAEVHYGIGAASQSTGTIAVLGMANINDDGAMVGEPGGFVESVDRTLLLREGDLLFNRTNSLAKVGKVGLVRELLSPTTFASYLVCLRVSALAVSDYLNYALNTEEVLGIARATALPSIGQANLNPSRYSGLRIPLPPVATQHQIVKALDVERASMNSLRAKLERQIRLLREHRQALITAAVTGDMEVPGVAA